MHSLFSSDDVSSDTFWAMNRSASEWALERFLEEFSPPPPPSQQIAESPAAAAASPQSSSTVRADDDAAEVKNPDGHRRFPPVAATATLDSNQYRQFLKTQLDLACAAVALSRVTNRFDPFRF